MKKGLLAILMLTMPAFGQDCSNGKCLVSQPKPAAAEPLTLPTSDCPKYEWEFANEYQQWLRQDGKVIGQWYEPERQYYPWDGKECGKACHPPIDPPTRGAQFVMTDKIKKWCDNGVQSLKRNHSAPTFRYSGRKISDHQLKSAFDGTLADDSSKGWFVIVAQSQTVREQVESEWSKLPADFRARYLVWNMPPDHFSMQDRFSGKPRFATDGDPTIILQNSSGEVLFRRPRAGLHYVAADFKDLLKSDPNYQPALDPGAPAAKPVATVPAWAWVVGGVAVLALLRRKA